MDLAVIKNIIIEIPLMHLAILAGLCTLAAIIGRVKFVLIFVYGALIYWVFVMNREKFAFSEEANLLHTALFILVSIVFVGCSAWVLFMER